MSGRTQALIAAVMLLGMIGLGYWVVQLMGQSNSSPTTQIPQRNSEPLFELTPNTDQDYIARFSAQTATRTINGEMEHDASGATRLTMSNDSGKVMTTYTINGETIVCSDGSCISVGPTPSALPESQYSFDPAAAEQFRQNSTYKGAQDCPAGTCETWQVDMGNGDSGVFFMDSKGQLSKMTSKTSSGTYELVFQYKDVDIARPDNTQSLAR
ncbi:MAG: hypothetical protein WAT17_02940 [Candidatus Saccharimonadales bacterium]|jgi:hypothetical protein